MPYPIAHILFVLIFTSPAIYIYARDLASGSGTRAETRDILVVMILIGFGAIFPDFIKIFVLDDISHNIPFAAVAITIGFVFASLLYRNTRQGFLLSLFAGIGHLSHLILDDIGNYARLSYLYPFWCKDFTLRSARFLPPELEYSFVAIYILILMVISIYALDKLGWLKRS